MNENNCGIKGDRKDLWVNIIYVSYKKKYNIVNVLKLIYLKKIFID